MKCKVTFTIGEQEFSLDLETDSNSPILDLSIVDALALNADVREALSKQIKEKLENQTKLNKVTITDLVGKGKEKQVGLIGNCNIGFLKSEFPGVIFPDGVDANILLVDSLQLHGQPISGRIINSQGQELFVVSGKKDSTGKPIDIMRLANYLKTRLAMYRNAQYFAEDSIYYKELQAVLAERQKQRGKINSLQELIIDFLNNKDKYSSMFFINEKGELKSAYSILLKVANIVNNYTPRVDYNDFCVNTISHQILWLRDGTIIFEEKKLYPIVAKAYPDLLQKLGITSESEFKEFFNSKLSLDKVGIKGTGYEALFEYLFSTEPEFNLKFSYYNEKKFFFEAEAKSIQAKYGIEYLTILSFDIIREHKGYKIYSYQDEDGKTWYIPSRTYLHELVVAKKYNSEQGAIDYINAAIEKLIIRNHSFLAFKYRNKDLEGNYDSELSSYVVESPNQILTEGSIIESIDIPIYYKLRIYPGKENTLVNSNDRSSNYNTFIKIVDEWLISDEVKNRIKDVINTPEKIAVFIYKVNELLINDRTDSDTISLIVLMINTAPVRAYYIESRNGDKYKVIPTDPNKIEEYKKAKRTPVTSLMQAVSTVLKDKYGVEVNLVTSSEVSELFPTIDANTSKAFIRNGQIYVNTTIADSSDVLHEYTHLLLGILKTDPNLRQNYELLLHIVYNTTAGKRMARELKLAYSEVSEMDLMEEVFVKLFSNYLMKTIDYNTLLIFLVNEDFIKDATLMIFNNHVDNLASFYGRNIDTIFRRFSSDIAQLLDSNEIDFGATLTSRRYSNWISGQIRKGNIIEECHG